ncbi:S53 family peptidase [Xylella taiwanensis]|nr:S53 family peptidase [Xylella taiwanensis]UFS49191.1 S53 family peptidase [Xylella taiwanensis]
MTDRIPLPGSHRHLLPGTHDVGQASANEYLRVVIVLRQPALAEAAHALIRTKVPTPMLDRAHFMKRFAVPKEDLDLLDGFAAAYNLKVVRQEPAAGLVALEGTVADCNAAFGIDLRYHEKNNKRYRGRTGEITLPAALKDKVIAVMGLDARPHAGCSHPRRGLHDGPRIWYTPPQVAQLYGAPASEGHHRQRLGIIALDSGYRRDQVAAYFAEVGVPMPSIVDVEIAGAQPPAGPKDDGLETELDVQIAGSVAPGATLVVYRAPNSESGMLEAIVSAIHDQKSGCDVLSISWGLTESMWTDQALAAYEQAFQAAALMGITVCVASGDDGARGGAPGFNVYYPATSPYVLACGGTRLELRYIQTDEQAWSGSGGGESAKYECPAWQQGLVITAEKGGVTRTLTQRGVPDVAANADPETGYYIRVDGHPDTTWRP